MKNVIIFKEKLIKKIKENREKHRNEYLDAHDAWKQTVIDTLTKALKDAGNGKKYETNFHIPEPMNFLKEYDLALEQLDWTEEEMITLDQKDFKRFIQDDWEWKQSFDMTNAFYMKK